MVRSRVPTFFFTMLLFLGALLFFALGISGAEAAGRLCFGRLCMSVWPPGASIVDLTDPDNDGILTKDDACPASYYASGNGCPRVSSKYLVLDGWNVSNPKTKEIGYREPYSVYWEVTYTNPIAVSDRGKYWISEALNTSIVFSRDIERGTFQNTIQKRGEALIHSFNINGPGFSEAMGSVSVTMRDIDDDGVLNTADSCRLDPGVSEFNGCPPPNLPELKISSNQRDYGSEATVVEKARYDLYWGQSIGARGGSVALWATEKMFGRLGVPFQTDAFSIGGTIQAYAEAPAIPDVSEKTVYFELRLYTKDNVYYSSSNRVSLRITFKDRDGDGVRDTEDQCCSIKGSAFYVGYKGCPLPEPFIGTGHSLGDINVDCPRDVDCSGYCAPNTVDSSYGDCTEADRGSYRQCTDYTDSLYWACVPFGDCYWAKNPNGYDYRTLFCGGLLSFSPELSPCRD